MSVCCLVCNDDDYYHDDHGDRDHDSDLDLGAQGCALPWPPENCIEMWKAEKAQVTMLLMINDYDDNDALVGFFWKF